ncbi:cytochrome P450 [Priestia megaterium]|uniref:cytochrome P450 n=1 Tax=Priestia megaterium TaxID=1404 RepID=UPI003CFC6675
MANDLSLVPTMVEEVLRFYPPVQVPSRIAIKDVELRGKAIREGGAVTACSIS